MFECKTDYVDKEEDHIARECIMYGETSDDADGDGKADGDKFILDFSSHNYTIKDFRKYSDPDKIYITSSDVNIAPNEDKITVSESILKIEKKSSESSVEVDLSGFSEKEVEGWVEIATGTGEYADYSDEELKEKRKKNPIIITNK